MPQYMVDEDVAALVERLAKPKPFENLSFNAALKRVFQQYISSSEAADGLASLEQLLEEARQQKKEPTPSPVKWVLGVPELKGKKGLTTWKAVCDLLEIDTAGDSARRRLRNWVKVNRPMWPEVPRLKGD